MANLTEAAASGDRLQTLKELRGLLAERLEQSNSDRDIASMSKRLMDVTETIEALEQKKADAEQISSLDKLYSKYNFNPGGVQGKRKAL